MREVMINDYGKDKLKNLASYNELTHYPIIHRWVDCHVTVPNKKFIIYFAIPDDKGNVFVIPGKWCQDIRKCSKFKYAIDLNDLALDQLNKAGNFSGDVLYPIEDIWEIASSTDEGKKRFEVYFSVLDENKQIFIVQSNWGHVVVLDENDKALY